MDKDTKPFNQINLQNIIKQMGEEVNIENKVQEFLVDIGNDFIEKILQKSEEISEKKQDNRKSVEPSDVKFVLKTLYGIDLGRKSFDEVSSSGFKRHIKDNNKNTISAYQDDKALE